MIGIDRLLASGVRFVLDKVATAVDSELNDASRLHETLLEAQMQLELGEITEDEFALVESDVSLRLREIRAREREQVDTVNMRVAGVEIAIDDALDGD